MFTTKRLYEENSTLLTCYARVLDVIHENGMTVVILDQTVFRPQPAASREDGILPSDIGLIESENKRFHVTRVELVENGIHHIGVFEGNAFDADEEVTCTVNEKFYKELEENIVD